MANRLKELRKRKGITQAVIAQHLGISQNNYSYWESGRVKMDDESLGCLADYFEVSIDYLLCRKKPAEFCANMKEILEQDEITSDAGSIGEYIAFRMKGGSMGPRILDGDVVIIRVQDSVEDNQIAAVFVGESAVTLKRIKRESGGLWLISANVANSPMFYSEKECAELPIRILGRLVEVRQKY